MIQFLISQSQGGSGAGGWISILLFYLAIFAIFYFILIWPQRKERKRKEEMIKSLKKGDRIITNGGIRGEIVRVGDDYFIIQSENSALKIEKWAVLNKLEK